MHQTQTVTRSEAAFTILNAIKEIYDEKGSCIVAIDGNSGAGKSTLGAQIAAASHGTLLHTDDFFLISFRGHSPNHWSNSSIYAFVFSFAAGGAHRYMFGHRIYSNTYLHRLVDAYWGIQCMVSSVGSHNNVVLQLFSVTRTL